MGQIISGKSPLRIGLAGGGTDRNYIFERFGGAVVNCTIDKFCHQRIEKREDDSVFVNGKELNEDEILTSKVVEFFRPDFGFNLIYYNDISPGSGLGNSSSFVVLLLTLLNELNGVRKSDEQIVKDSYYVETQVKEGGWQDQYATSIGGFNFMEFNDKTLVYPLRLRYRFLQELNEHLILVKIDGKKGDICKDLREYSEENPDELKRTSEIKHLAFEMRDCLLNQNINKIGKILDDNWKLKRNKFTTNKKVDQLYNLALDNGADGGKLCGNGQAGHFLLFVKPENRLNLIKALKDYKIVNFNLVVNGTETWRI